MAKPGIWKILLAVGIGLALVAFILGRQRTASERSLRENHRLLSVSLRMDRLRRARLARVSALQWLDVGILWPVGILSTTSSTLHHDLQALARR